MNIPFYQRKGCVIVAVLTESDVRRLLKKEHLTEMIIAKGTIVTPSAKGFLTDRGINVIIEGSPKLHQEDTTTSEDELPVDEVTKVTEKDSQPVETYPLKKIRIQWSLFKLEVIKTQKALEKLEKENLKDDLQIVLKTIDDVLESLSQGNCVNTSYLSHVTETEEVEINFEMDESYLELSRLSLLCEDVCCETVTRFSNGFGVSLREDLVELETKLPLYIQSLMNK